MELLASYGKRTARDSNALAVVVSRDVIGCNGKPIHLRTGETLPKFVRGVAFSRNGHLVVIKLEGAAVEHPDGHVVPLKVDGAAVLEPLFVGNALVMQDDASRQRGPGVFDITTGAQRGRLDHARVTYGTHSLVQAFLWDANDGRHVWAAEASRLRLWDLESVRCAREVVMPAGMSCAAGGLLPDGSLVTSIRPAEDATPERTELIVLTADTITKKRAIPVSALLVVGRRIVAYPWLGKHLVVLDENLEQVETIPLDPTMGSMNPMLNLWSGEDEFLGVGTFNQVHHFGDASLKPVPGPAAAEAPAKGGKAAPAKKATKKKAP